MNPTPWEFFEIRLVERIEQEETEVTEKDKSDFCFSVSSAESHERRRKAGCNRCNKLQQRFSKVLHAINDCYQLIYVKNLIARRALLVKNVLQSVVKCCVDRIGAIKNAVFRVRQRVQQRFSCCTIATWSRR